MIPGLGRMIDLCMYDLESIKSESKERNGFLIQRIVRHRDSQRNCAHTHSEPETALRMLSLRA